MGSKMEVGVVSGSFAESSLWPLALTLLSHLGYHTVKMVVSPSDCTAISHQHIRVFGTGDLVSLQLLTASH